MAAPNMLAGGDISPCRFVKQDPTATTGDHKVLQCSAGQVIFGVSQEGSNKAPIPEVTTNLAAASGEQVKIYGDDEVVLLEIGTGGCTSGNLLKSDADGKGVVASAGENIGAAALVTAAAGSLARVQVVARGLAKT